MLTSSRGEVHQDDLQSGEELPYELNEHGKRIIELYRKIPEQLDTIAYQSKNDFTLYFP